MFRTLWGEMISIVRSEHTHQALSDLILKEVEGYDAAKRAVAEDFFRMIIGSNLTTLLGRASGLNEDEVQDLTFEQAAQAYKVARAEWYQAKDQAYRAAHGGRGMNDGIIRDDKEVKKREEQAARAYRAAHGMEETE